MSDRNVRKVVVAGGGSAGWMAAAALSRQLGPLLDITLVEIDEIGTVGVGESTVPTAPHVQRPAQSRRTRIHGRHPGDVQAGHLVRELGRDRRPLHPLLRPDRKIQLARPFPSLLAGSPGSGVRRDLGDYCLELKAAEQDRFYTDDNSTMNFAYHIDAALYGRYLRQKCEDKGGAPRRGQDHQRPAARRRRLRRGAGAGKRPGDRGRPLHRLHELSRPADQWRAGRRVRGLGQLAAQRPGLGGADQFERPARTLHPRHRPQGRLALGHPAAGAGRQRPCLFQPVHERRRGAGDAPRHGRGRDADRAQADQVPRRPSPPRPGARTLSRWVWPPASSSRWDRPRST